MADDKNLRTQQDRIERLVAEVMPHVRVEFNAQEPNRIMFRIVDANSDALLAASGQLRLSELVGKSDEWVRQYICHLGGGDI